jgi:hypothetical protein
MFFIFQEFSVAVIVSRECTATHCWHKTVRMMQSCSDSSVQNWAKKESPLGPWRTHFHLDIACRGDGVLRESHNGNARPPPVIWSRRPLPNMRVLPIAWQCEHWRESKLKKTFVLSDFMVDGDDCIWIETKDVTLGQSIDDAVKDYSKPSAPFINRV